MTAKVALGVDVGGTYSKIAVVDISGKILRETSLETKPSHGPEAFVRRLGELLVSWRVSKIGAVGLGLAGGVDAERGVLEFVPNLKGWDGFNFKKAFAHRLGLRLIVDNDANVAVWGGYVMELQRKPRSLIGVTLGTGVGGAIILGGALYRGATGSAGEIGHMRIESSGGRQCHCGAYGCLEAYAGSYGIVHTARQLLDEKPGSGKILRALCPDLAKLEPSILSQAARQGDRIARAAWDYTGRMLAIGLANLVMAFNPDAVLILGGVSAAGSLLLQPIRRNFSSYAFQTPFEHIQLRLGAQRKWGCIGAALLALEDEKG